MAMCIAQNGPGITNFVTPIKTAYWNHTPLLLVTPQAANRTIGQGGFQEIPQMSLFADMVCYQEEVRDPARIAEVLNRVIEKAWRGSAPAQINVPRDYWTQRDRHRAAAGRPLRAAGRRRGGDRAGGGAAVGGAVPGHPERRRRGARAVRSPASAALAERLVGAGRLQLPAQRRLPGLATRSRSGRSATTARRRRWS